MADVVALVCVMATVAAVHPLYLLFLVPVFFVFAVEVYKSKCVYRRDMSMTANKRMQAYVQRTVYLREYAKDMRTSNIFAVMVRRMEAATKANVRILRDYGVRLFLYSVVSSLLGELLPVLGTYAFACHSFVQGGGLTVSGFSVVASGINAVRESTLDTTECFDEMTLLALYFQNLREFLDYQPQVVSGPLPVPPLETLEFAMWTLPTRAPIDGCSTMLTLPCGRARPWRWWALTAPANPRWSSCCCDFTTLRLVKFSITASRCRNMTWSSCGLPLAPCFRIIKTLPCPSTRM